MKVSLDLTYNTTQEWVNTVLNNFDDFLQDHADCERKASSMAMSFVAKCPDRVEIIPLLIETAVEEIEHFRDVYQLMETRNVQLKSKMPEDLYMKQLLQLCRSDRDERLMDRLLIASIVECRGAERFRLVAENAKDDTIKEFYKRLWTCEAKHGNIFVEMAMIYWNNEEVLKRLDEINTEEGKICSNLEIRPALH